MRGNGHQPLRKAEEILLQGAIQLEETWTTSAVPVFWCFFWSIQVEMPEANTETDDSLELIWHSFGISYFLNIQLLILQILRQNKWMQKPSNPMFGPTMLSDHHIISMGTSCRPGPLSQVGHSTRASCATESPALLDECLIALDHTWTVWAGKWMWVQLGHKSWMINQHDQHDQTCTHGLKVSMPKSSECQAKRWKQNRREMLWRTQFLVIPSYTMLYPSNFRFRKFHQCFCLIRTIEPSQFWVPSILSTPFHG